MRVFFCGDISHSGKTGWQRYHTFKELGVDAVSFQQDFNNRIPLFKKFKTKLMGTEIFDSNVVQRFNDEFLGQLKESRPNVAWVEKALMLLPETLVLAKKVFPDCIFVCFQADNPFSDDRPEEKPLWRYFKQAIPLYDIHFVKRDIDIVNFTNAGAQRVELYRAGFYPKIFNPCRKEDRKGFDKEFDVTLVATNLERKRAQFISCLMLKYGIPVHVFGSRWERSLIYYWKRRGFNPAVFSQDYVQKIYQSKVCLGLVSHSNKDEYSDRTFEIPACKGFLLAERTPIHLQLFEEGREAEFFDSPEECADKVNYYLRNETERLKIAEAGYQRCIRDDYSMSRRLLDAMAIIERLRESGTVNL